MIIIIEKICSFFGHREIVETESLKKQLIETIEMLITKENVTTFLFGSKSRFNNLCYESVTKLKEKYPEVKRIYVRAEFPIIDDKYKLYLLKHYEETYYPEKIIGANKAVYLKRNYKMIDNCNICVVYFDEEYSPKNRKSGTKLALEYALKKNKEIYIFSSKNI